MFVGIKLCSRIKLKSEFDCPIQSSNFCNKDIATLKIKESRLLVLKYVFLYISKIIDMSEKQALLISLFVFV
jgi:hypothetical protein